MMKEILLSILILNFGQNYCRAQNSHFWTNEWRRKIPKSMKSEQFHAITASFKLEFELLHEQLKKINQKIHQNHPIKSGKFTVVFFKNKITKFFFDSQ